MTLVNVTIARDRSFAVLSADTFLGSAAGNGGGITTDSGAHSTGQTGAAGEVQGEVCKLLAQPHLGAVLTGAGASIFFLELAQPLTLGGRAGIRELVDWLPGKLRATAEKWPGRTYTAIAVGWDAAEGRVFGAAFAAPEFAPVELRPGHSMQPPPDAEAEDYPAEGWVEAIDGEAVEEWHVRMARHQARAYAGADVPLGGRLTLARIDAAGIRFRAVDAF